MGQQGLYLHDGISENATLDYASSDTLENTSDRAEVGPLLGQFFLSRYHGLLEVLGVSCLVLMCRNELCELAKLRQGIMGGCLTVL